MVGDDYIPFESYINDFFGSRITVIGVGTVHLPTKTSPHRNGPALTGTLKLKNVLHVPSFRCNIIGNGVRDDYIVEMRPGGASKGTITDPSTGRAVAYFKPDAEDNPFWAVQLRAPPVGPAVGPWSFRAGQDY